MRSTTVASIHNSSLTFFFHESPLVGVAVAPITPAHVTIGCQRAHSICRKCREEENSKRSPLQGTEAVGSDYCCSGT